MPESFFSLLSNSIINFFPPLIISISSSSSLEYPSLTIPPSVNLIGGLSHIALYISLLSSFSGSIFLNSENKGDLRYFTLSCILGIKRRESLIARTSLGLAVPLFILVRSQIGRAHV